MLKINENALIFIYFACQIIQIVTLWLCIKTIISMFIWFQYKDTIDNDKRFGIFLCDAFCFLRMLAGLIFCKLNGYGYLFLCTKSFNLDLIIKPVIELISVFGLSMLIRNKTCSLTEYYKGDTNE